MRASQVEPERFGNSEFPDAKKAEVGTRLEGSKAVIGITEFKSKKNYRGVSLKLKDGTVVYTTASQPVGYILSEKLNLKGAIEKSNGKGVDLFFTKDVANTGRDQIKCSIFP